MTSDTPQPSDPFLYPGSDQHPKIGDRVRFVDDPDILLVEDVIDSVETQRAWGLDEFGLMLKGGRYGLVFTRITDPELEFVGRDENSGS